MHTHVFPPLLLVKLILPGPAGSIAGLFLFFPLLRFRLTHIILFLHLLRKAAAP